MFSFLRKSSPLAAYKDDVRIVLQGELGLDMDARDLAGWDRTLKTYLDEGKSPRDAALSIGVNTLASAFDIHQDDALDRYADAVERICILLPQTSGNKARVEEILCNGLEARGARAPFSPMCHAVFSEQRITSWQEGIVAEHPRPLQTGPEFYERLLNMDLGTASGEPREPSRNAARVGAFRAELYAKTMKIIRETAEKEWQGTSIQTRDQTERNVVVDVSGLMAITAMTEMLMLPEDNFLAAASLQWMLDTPQAEWVFQEVCIAVHAYFQVPAARELVTSHEQEQVEALRDLLRDAVRHSNIA